MDEPLFAPADLDVQRRPDGSVLLGSGAELRPYPTTVIAALRDWATKDPDHPVIARRGPDGGWVTRTYRQAVEAADALGQAFLDRGLSAERPLLVLSGNSIEHFLVMLGALTAGVPIVPTSVAYSLQSSDHRRIGEINALVRPGAVFVDDTEKFAPALEVVRGVPVVGMDLLETTPQTAVEDAYAAITPDSVAKILFTSGSTGDAKGVVNTHRMLSSNQQSIRQIWPFLTDHRPVLLDWLPWSHTFGGNHNVNLAITNGGTLYIDDGRPTPDLIGQSIRNLADVRPTICFNVPAAWAQLLPQLEKDDDFAQRFFSRLRLMFNAAAALPSTIRKRLEDRAHQVTGRRIPVTGSWGATETAPAVTSAHFHFTDARCIGIPIPGAEVKLVPAEDAYEIRVRGPMVTPGYWKRPDLTEAAFDEEGFYRSGDAVDLIDGAIVFRSRIAEDFKLSTGTFVRVGAVRTALLAAMPMLLDAVIVGEHRDYVGALAWLRRDDESTADAEVLGQLLAVYNSSVGSAARVEALLLLTEPASLDRAEITDKGYVNQRQVIANRAALVERLYENPPPAAVIRPR